jgi:hypothetical protein
LAKAAWILCRSAMQTLCTPFGSVKNCVKNLFKSLLKVGERFAAEI